VLGQLLEAHGPPCVRGGFARLCFL
jgi:hypothetical protein